MSECNEYQALISRMLDEDLSEAELARLHAHIAECQDCRRLLDAFSMLHSAVTEDLPEPPAELAVSVMAQLRRESVSAAKKRRVPAVRWVALAACLAVVVFSAYRFDLFGGKNKTADAAEMANGSSQFLYDAVKADTTAAAAPAAEPAEAYIFESESEAVCGAAGATESFSLCAVDYRTDSAAEEAPAYLDYAGERWQLAGCVEAPPDSGEPAAATEHKAEETSVRLVDGRLYMYLKDALWAVYEK